MYLRLTFFLISSLDLTACSLVAADRPGVLLTKSLPWRAAPLRTFGGGPSPISVLIALRLSEPSPSTRGFPSMVCGWSPDPLSHPLGRPDGNVSAVTQPACSAGGSLRWQLQTRLAAVVPSAPHLFQPLFVLCHQPSLPVLHGKRQLFTALNNFSCWASILSKPNCQVNSILTQQQPTQSK